MLTDLQRERFELSVIRRGPDECWGWSGLNNGIGYGLVYAQGTLTLAHRLSYETC